MIRLTTNATRKRASNPNNPRVTHMIICQEGGESAPDAPGTTREWPVTMVNS
jgi:hypothetical protein